MGNTPGPGNTRDEAVEFGRELGKRTATEITKEGLSEPELIALGEAGVSAVQDWAQSLARAGLDLGTVDELTEIAAEAFHLELERAATLLLAPAPSASKN